MRARTSTCAVLAACLLLALTATVQAEVFFHEKFENLDGWVTSSHKSDYGKIALSAGAHPVDAEKNKGLQLTEDARFYAVSKKLPTPVTNAGKKDFVVSFSVRNEQNLQCGGAYLKFMSDLKQADFHGESPYWLMFGPDVCGGTNKIHIIFHHGGQNLNWKKTVPSPKDKLTHVYTLHVSPDNTYELYVDGTSTKKGSLEEDWKFLPPKTIPDPKDTKPADWVDASMIIDENDKKPDDWDNEPATIVDSDATKPEDWDDAEDGEWEAPMIPNPGYKGEWHPKRIPNPAYKGPWAPKQIPNPEYKADDGLYQIPAALQYVGIDVWQVEAGSIFGNIVLGDDVKEVLAIVKETYSDISEKEKELVKAAEEAAAAEHAHDHDDDDDDDEDL